MKEPKLEKGNIPKDILKKSEVKPIRPEQPGERPKPTPNPPKKK
ncbi:MAG: hypothetical protein ACLQDF_03725 [Desulfomonilia bacterium]